MTYPSKRLSAISLYGCFWFFVNLVTIIRYPIMHSDEAWLAGLTDHMLSSGSLMVTEPFFDLAPRAPHTLKTLYHLLQMPFLLLFGHELLSVRLLSLTFASGVLILLFLHFRHSSILAWLLIPGTLLFHTQFVYSSHFARQEIALVFILILCWHLYTKQETIDRQLTLWISSIIGLSISLHPNAFMIAMMIGMLYVLDWIRRKISFDLLLHYTWPMGLFAGLNILVTLSSTPDFISRYSLYASTLSVGAPPSSRLVNFLEFYVKLWQQISGTYYLPDIRPLFVMTLLLLSITFIVAGLKRLRPAALLPIIQLLMMEIGYNIALFIVGRNNPTSIVFLTVLLSLISLHCLLVLLKDPLLITGLLVVNVLLLYGTYQDAQEHANHDYQAYEDFLKTSIEKDDVILGNLTGGFALNNNEFYDVRNLAWLEGQSIEAYLVSKGIDTVIWYEEYAYIHRNPEWQILYGDDAAYYDDFLLILEEKGTKIAETESLWYGNRIICYMGDYPWRITIYHLSQ